MTSLDNTIPTRPLPQLKERRLPDACRPEQVVYLWATLHASNKDGLGAFVRSSLQSPSSRRWEGQEGEAASPAASSSQSRTWISALDLSEPLVATYILASDEPWERKPACSPGMTVQLAGTEDIWSCWPYRERLTFESQLKPW